MYIDLSTASFDSDERILHGHLERHVARHDRDADNLDVWMLQRNDECDHIVAGGVGIDPNTSLHAWSR
jgi:hypothetical protein